MYPNSASQSSCGGETPNNQPQVHQNTGNTRLTIKGYANNEIRLILSTSSLNRKTAGDKAIERKNQHKAELLKLVEQCKGWLQQLILGNEPELWFPVSGSGITTARIHKDICEIDYRNYAEFSAEFSKKNKENSVSPSEYERQISAIINEWKAKNHKYPIPVEFTLIVKEVHKQWDQTITLDTEWLADEPDSPHSSFYRAKPCSEIVQVPTSRIGRLPGTAIKVTWHKYTISKAECERVLAAATAALDIKNVLQEITKLGCDNPQRSFTTVARHKLLEAGAVTDKLAGLNAAVITLTLPGSTLASVRALAAYSGWIVNSLFQIIRDYRKRTKKKVEYFFVWELQMKRASKNLAPALHIHICLAAPANEVPIDRLLKLGYKMKDKWFSLLKEMATTKAVKRFGKKEGNLPGIDMFSRANQHGKIKSWLNHPDEWRWDIQQVRKSVAAYFAKYAGKNGAPANKNQFEKYAKAGNKCYSPSRWWGVSGGIRELIKANRFEYTIDMANLDCTGTLEGIRGELELQPVVKAYGTSWQVLESKYKEAIIDGKKCYCKKGLIKGELEPVMLASQGDNPTRILIQGHTEIYYFEPERFQEVWEFWREQKGLIEDLAGKIRKSVNSNLRL